MRSVLLIAPHNSYRIHAYIEAAQRLDIALVIASQSEFSLVSAVANGIQIDFSDTALSLQRIVTAHQEHQFSAVIASDDGSVALAALVGTTLGLSANAEDSAKLTRRKDLARLRLKQHGQPLPDFRVVNISLPLLDQLSQLNYPVVVKPVSMSGSKGVIKANNEQECIAAVERIKPFLSHLVNEEERKTILIEGFLDGPEVAYEGLLDKGRLRQLVIFDKPEPMNGPFFEESYYISSSRHSVAWQKIIHQRVSEACVAYGLTEGPVHAELRLIDNDAYIIEIAARTIGGDCADMLKFGLNIGLEELVLLQAMGKPIDIPEMKNSVGVLMIPIPEQGILRRVEGIAQAREINYITDIGISVREGYELLPLPEGSSYLGFIFAKAPTQHLVESALRAAHACLNVVIAPSFKVQLG